MIRIPQAKFFCSSDATGRKFPGFWNLDSRTDDFFLFNCFSLLLKDARSEGPSTSFARGPLRVTLVGDEWGSSKGELSTLNRELAKHLARQPDVEVTVLLLHHNEKEKKEADEVNVRLATPQTISVLDPLMRLCFPSDSLGIDVVIDHGQKLGAPAQIIAKQRKCKRVHIVHTASEELAMFKESETALPKGEKKHQAELELCKEAEIVAAIGPKLAEAISAPLRSYRKDQQVIDITPGIFPEFTKMEQASEERGKFRILVFGRGDSEDFELKGYDIAAQAVAGLNDKSYLLIFVGAPKGKEEEVKNNLLKCGIFRSQLIVRGFIESRSELEKLFCEADLAIMPSRTEGFGLAALEALSAGLPILVGDNSGFGKALQTLTFGSSFMVDSNEVEEWGKAIRRARQKERQIRLNEALSLREFYDEKFKWEAQCKILVEKMRLFFNKLQGSFLILARVV